MGLNITRLSNTALAMFLAALAACNSPKEESKETAAEDTLKTDTVKLKTADKIAYSLPSPLKIAKLLKKSGAHFSEGIINSPENAKNYSTNFSKGLNMGVYGADIAFTTIHNQTQQSINCLKASKTLADGLGISAVFTSRDLVKRFENNLGNKDSLFVIISDLYRESDTYLKDNDNVSTASLIITGGWVEGLYIATQSLEKNKNDDLVERIAEQKLPLDNLINIISDFKDQKEFEGLLNDLKNIQAAYDKITISYDQKAASKEGDVTVLNTESETKVKEGALKEITEKIAVLRSKIIKLS